MPVTLAQLAPVALGLAGIGIALALRRAARRPGSIEPLGRSERPRPAPLPLVPLDSGPAVTVIDLLGFAILALAGAVWLWPL